MSLTEVEDMSGRLPLISLCLVRNERPLDYQLEIKIALQGMVSLNF
jgi:hypothetical protein